MTKTSEVEFDLSKVTLGEYRGLFEDKADLKYQDEILRKVTGLTQDEVLALPLLESKQLWRAFLKKAREPLEEKNLVSASIST
jgi:hypothetical protein